MLRLPPAEIEGWDGDAASPWAIRVFNNLFPRIPAALTGGRNESYVVVEDSRHFLARRAFRERSPVYRRAARGPFLPPAAGQR